MKKLTISVFSCGLFVLLTCVGYAQESTQIDDLPYSEQLKSQQPFGGLENSLKKLEELNNEGEYDQALKLGLMLIARYFDHRIPLFLSCGRSLAGLEKWSDCIEAYSLAVETARKGANIKGATEAYMQDAEINLAHIYVRRRDVVAPAKLQPVNSAEKIADRVLEKYPDGSLYLLSEYRAMRHPEALLLLADITILDPTDEAKTRSLLETLEEFIPDRSPRRMNIRTKAAMPYSTLALDRWWKISEAFRCETSNMESALKDFEKAQDKETKALASLLLGKLTEETGGDRQSARSYYMKGLSYQIESDEEPLSSYFKEAAKRIAD